MALTDTAIRTAKPTEKPQKLSDGGGLFLLLNPNGGKWWRLKYRIDGKEKLLSLGTYPEVSLKDARERREEARRLLAAGVDPSVHRQATKAAREAENANTFEVVGREWFGKQSPNWAPSHAEKVLARLENDLFPYLGKRPIGAITAPELLAALRRIEERGAVDTSHRARQNCSQIFRYAIATGRADRDPATDLKGALAPAKQSHFASMIDPKAIAGLLRAMDGYQGEPVTKGALRLAPLVFVRPGELRHAEWSEIDLDKAEWNIPAEKMKMREPHLVPLSAQAIAVLRDLQPLTGDGRYVFPSPRTRKKPISDNAILAALRRMGFAKEEMSGHGFRAMARTLLDEVLHVRPDYIEHQLAHAVRDPNGRAYNRTAHLVERKKMMQLWADYLDKIKAETNVIPFKALNSRSNETGDSVAIHQGEPQKRRGIEGRPVSPLLEEMRLSAERHTKEAATKPTTNSKVAAPTGEEAISEIVKKQMFNNGFGSQMTIATASASNPQAASNEVNNPSIEVAVAEIINKQMFNKGFGHRKENTPENSVSPSNTQQTDSADPKNGADEKPKSLSAKKS
jgi:integrase